MQTPGLAGWQDSFVARLPSRAKSESVTESYDVVIIGGAAMGSSVAYFLTSDRDFDGTVAIIERDPGFVRASTFLSASSMRVQFSNPLNIMISQFGREFFRDFSRLTAVDGEAENLNFHESGYLFIAVNDEQAEVLRENHRIQVEMGCDVSLWDADMLQDAFPHLNVEDVVLASYGNAGEGWYSNSALANGLRRKAIDQGASFLTDEVVGLDRTGNRIDGVVLASGRRVGCGHVINCAGPSASHVGRMAGIALPVEPRKRTVFVFDCANSPEGSARINGGRLPLMIESTGTYCRPEGRYFLAGTTPCVDQAAELDDFEPCHDEFDRIWSDLASRSRNFEAVKLLRFWAGQYDFNVFDQNAIIGPHDTFGNFLFANGFTGHGLQQSPAVGRGLAELVVHGRYRTIDLSALSFERIADNRPFLERAVI